MLKPIDQTSRIEGHPQIDFAQGTLPVRFADELVAAKQRSPVLKWIETSLTKAWNWIQKTPSLRGIRNFLAKVYHWIKYDLFFLFNDEEEEFNEEYRTEIAEFQDLYLDMMDAKTEAGRRTVKKNFYGLSKGLQKLIKEELCTILKADRTDLSPDEISTRVNEVMNDPFKSFDVEANKEKMEGNIIRDPRLEPMARAILSTKNKL